MAEIKYKTLTPIHIGSGRQLQGNIEYLYFANEKCIVVIDESKVLDIIGLQEVDKWVSIITKREDLLPYLQTRCTNLKADDIALRKMATLGKLPKSENNISEQVHSGNGHPIMPGSSIKGSIRTAIFNSLLENDNEIVNEPEFTRAKRRDFKTGISKFEDKNLLKHFFGNTANQDFLRLLQVGDVQFNNTVCMLSETLNTNGDEYLMKEKVKQFVECIPANTESIGKIHIPADLKKQIKNINFIDYNLLEMIDLPQIFATVNKLTDYLVSNEIDVYKDENLPADAQLLVETYQNILNEIANCSENECVIRIGFGSGFKFMTGDWVDFMNEDTYNDFLQIVQKPEYKDFPYPKTRKTILEGNLLGFVKLTILK